MANNQQQTTNNKQPIR